MAYRYVLRPSHSLNTLSKDLPCSVLSYTRIHAEEDFASDVRHLWHYILDYPCIHATYHLLSKLFPALLFPPAIPVPVADQVSLEDLLLFVLDVVVGLPVHHAALVLGLLRKRPLELLE